MPTTSNFGWTTPADTDLVKDGAAAIRTLGNGIDTSLVDLKGGTTGQILSKNSNTDLDYTWINNDQGDITAVTAGTGLTGGGTTGAVTLTNDMATTITAAGDIVVGTGNGTYDNLPIGTTGQVLTADTTVSPYKVKWDAPSSASGPTFLATRESTQSVTNNTATKVQFNTEIFDTDSNYDPTTNYRFTPNKAGYYQVNLSVYANASSGATRVRALLYKNGSLYEVLADVKGSESLTAAGGAIIVYLNGSSDYIEGFGTVANTNSPEFYGDGNNNCCFSAIWIRS